MATRTFRPNANNEGGIGSSLYRWANGFFTALTTTSVTAATANITSLSAGTVTPSTPIAVANGGTGAATAANARTNLEVYSTGETNTRLNALAPRQGVQLTQQLANTDAATSLLLTNPDAFTLYWEGVITRYPTSANPPFIGNVRGTTTAVAGSFGLVIDSTGLVRALNEKDGATVEFETFAYTAPLNTPLSLALTLDKATRVTRLYVNGVQVGGDQTFDSLTITSTTEPVKLMSRSQSDIDGGRNVNGVTYQAGILNFAAPATTTSGVVGVAERYASGVWVQPSERVVTGVVTGTPAATSGAAIAGATTAGGSVTFTTGSTGFVNLRTLGDAAAPAGIYRIKFTVTVTGGALAQTTIRFNNASPSFAVVEGDNEVIASHNGLSQIFIRIDGSAASFTFDITNLELLLVGSTLDLIPQGVGRVLIDRSASRNHAIVSGTVHPTYLQPAESGRIIATTALGSFAQLLGLSAFDAANKYRITSWVVTCPTSATISLSNTNSGAVYVSGLALSGGVPTAVPLLTSIATTANLWCTADTAVPVTHVINYERIDK
jgi:hypothetical protein